MECESTSTYSAAALLCALTLFASLQTAYGGQALNVEAGVTTDMLLAAAAPAAAATPAAAAEQSALRNAIAKASKWPVSFTLTTDIVLTAPLAVLKSGVKVFVSGNCKHRNGEPRSCVVDGAGKHSVFSAESTSACNISLEGLVIQNVLGNVLVGPCSMSARHVVFRNNVGPKGVVLDATTSLHKFSHCHFENNTALLGNGGVFNVHNDPAVGNGVSVGEPMMLSLMHCTFRNNHAVKGQGGAIFAEGNGVIFRNVVFKQNSAVSGGAIGTTAATLTAINTTFVANSATNGRGGAVAATGRGPKSAYKFCQCTFRSNAANPRRHRSSDNVLFWMGSYRASVSFCPGPAPRGVRAPPRNSVDRNCSGCSGCEADCHGRGRCVPDPIFALPSCRCNAFFQDSSACTDCRQGYTRQSNCRRCTTAYYHPKAKPATCALCPGLSQVLKHNYLINSINNVTAAAEPLQCQQQCNVTQQPFKGNGNRYAYCNMWIHVPPRDGTPRACAGKCLMLSHSTICRLGPIQHIAYSGITYQYFELDQVACSDDLTPLSIH